MSLAIIYLEVIIMLIPNDLIKKFNSNCDKNINNLNNKKVLDKREAVDNAFYDTYNSLMNAINSCKRSR